MSGFLSKYKRLLIYAFVSIVCASFFLYFCAALGEYSSSVNDQAIERAGFYTQEQNGYIKEQFDSLKRDTEFAAKKISSLTNYDEFRHVFNSIEDVISSAAFLDAFYLKNGVMLNANGEIIDLYRDIFLANSVDNTVISKTFQFENRIMALAVSTKTDSEFADKIITVFDRAVASFPDRGLTETANYEFFKKTEFALLCKYDGKIVDRVINSDNFEIGNDPVQDGLIKTFFDDYESVQQVAKALFSEGIESFVFKNGSNDYVLSVGSLGVEYGNAAIVSAYKVSDIYGEGFTVMQNLSAALACLGICLISALIAVIIGGVNARRKLILQETVVPFLNCPTSIKFERNAEEILKRYANSKFAFVSLQINNFGYVAEHFGDDAVKKASIFVANNLRRMMMAEETFGYCENGEFMLLLHFKSKQALSERLNGLYLRLSAFGDLGDDYKVGATFAVYEAEKQQKQTIKQMLDKLNMAKEHSLSKKALFSIAFYDDSMRQSYLKKAEIESRMEQALKNSEFHLFYQPKYNLKKKNLDGCEVLVRWYDPEIGKYHLPSEFLPVFEENGFIAKLDRFVFFKSCENISKRIENRQICYPVSVNVSRITAIQADFIDYYVRIKNKFNIKDNFITLEFTESFAYENYEFLKGIVEKLHESGFLCSIDDFGTGYSSYNILKTIEMDEIKLDKFFLSKGYSAERDQTLLQSVIEMVKKLGMKVIQEGVELKEDLYRLEELGCDVIQGYYFAKPMKYSDYCEFTDKNFI